MLLLLLFFPRRVFYICLTPQAVGLTVVLILTFTMSDTYFNIAVAFYISLYLFLISASKILSMADFTIGCPLLPWSSIFLIIRNSGHIFIQI